MRDEARIDEFCDRLKEYWRLVPDWRFGQMIMNVFTELAAKGRDPFFPEEPEMLEFFEEYFAPYRG